MATEEAGQIIADKLVAQIIDEHYVRHENAIELQQLLPPIVRCRGKPTTDMKAVQELKEKMDLTGPSHQTNPIIVMDKHTAKGKYTIVDGDTRVFLYRTYHSETVSHTAAIVLDTKLTHEEMLKVSAFRCYSSTCPCTYILCSHSHPFSICTDPKIFKPPDTVLQGRHNC
jgi:hypothetical protein